MTAIEALRIIDRFCNDKQEKIGEDFEVTSHQDGRHTAFWEVRHKIRHLKEKLEAEQQEAK